MQLQEGGQQAGLWAFPPPLAPKLCLHLFVFCLERQFP